MSEYKEGTVGWWLNRLKEPLRSRATALLNALGEEIGSLPASHMLHAIRELSPLYANSPDKLFFHGVRAFFTNIPRGDAKNDKWYEGWDMAKECAPKPSIVGKEIGAEGPPPGRLNVVKDLGALGEGKLLAGDGPENQASHFAPKSCGFIDPDSAMKSHVAKLEARVSLLEDTLAAFIQFVNENLCDGGEFTH